MNNNKPATTATMIIHIGTGSTSWWSRISGYTIVSAYILKYKLK